MKKASKKVTRASSPKIAPSQPAPVPAKGKSAPAPAPQEKPAVTGKVSAKVQKEIVQKLFTLGKKQGFVTLEQMKKQLPEEMNNPEKVEELIIALNDKGIEITSGGIGPNGKPVTEAIQDVEAKKGKDTELEEDAAVEEYERVRIDDPVRTYLRQMGADLPSHEGTGN